jgi:hypothetical protein
VALPAKRDQVGLSVVTEGTAPSHVVNIEILAAATDLAAPVIAR